MAEPFILTVTDDETDDVRFYQVGDDASVLRDAAVQWMRKEYAEAFTHEVRSQPPVAEIANDYDYIVWLGDNVEGMPRIIIHRSEEEVMHVMLFRHWKIIQDKHGRFWQIQLRQPVPGWEGWVPTVVCLATGERISGQREELSDAEAWCYEHIEAA
jgi:hypothetical protein